MDAPSSFLKCLLPKPILLRVFKQQKPLIKSGVSQKLTTGIEPVTSSLPMRCATNCATSAYYEIIVFIFYAINTISKTTI